jgi:hypothetical protein
VLRDSHTDRAVGTAAKKKNGFEHFRGSTEKNRHTAVGWIDGYLSCEFKVKGGDIMAEEKKRQLTPSECAWEEINQAGAYVSRETGRLFRIPKEALAPGASPLIHQESRESDKFVKVSDDPDVPSLKAKMVAAENNIQPNF